MMITNLPKIIFLCGFMGAGKSTVGKKLARSLKLAYRDLDEWIEEQENKSIRQIFEESGESAFRQYERRYLLELTRNYEGVLSLGGGTLQNQRLLDHIKLNGLLVFIETPFSVILNRILWGRERPLLLDDDGNPKDRQAVKTYLEELYESRLPYYQQAEIKITNSNDRPLDKTVEELVKKIRNHVSSY